jgi:hypothetical protein
LDEDVDVDDDGDDVGGGWSHPKAMLAVFPSSELL